MRLKTLAEIYTMHSFAQLCNLIFCQNLPFKKTKFCKIFKLAKFLKNFANVGKILANLKFLKNVILELCKGVHRVDLGESFPTHIYLQNLASIQPRTSPLKFAGGGGYYRTNRAAGCTSSSRTPSRAPPTCPSGLGLHRSMGQILGGLVLGCIEAKFCK